MADFLPPSADAHSFGRISRPVGVLLRNILPDTSLIPTFASEHPVQHCVRCRTFMARAKLGVVEGYLK